MSQRTTFRPDIQGLRAVAVGLVILAHAGSVRFAGGYIGVDVFFVISGFLIIGLLVGEAERNGRISIPGFYTRRARRILPAASLVLVTTVVASALLLPFVRSAEIFVDAIWASLFGANLRFLVVETDYFAADEPASVLQHYWSLSIEEQFYVVVPVVLALVVWFAVRRRNGLDTPPRLPLRHTVVAVMATATVASFAWSVHATAVNPTSAYFSTFTRIWELGAGGLLGALLWGRSWWAPRWLLTAMSIVGLALIGWATITFDAHTSFPGVAALAPVGGSALLLTAGAFVGGQTNPVARLLSLPPARVTGDWSYSLYLWHFPVLHFAAELTGPLDRPTALAAIAVTFLLSGVTYHLVEEPFRRRSWWRRPSRALPLYPVSVGLVVITALSTGFWVEHRIADRDTVPAITVPSPAAGDTDEEPEVAMVRASVEAAIAGHDVPGRLRPELGEVRESIAPLGECDYRTGTRRLCAMGDPTAERTIVVMGDSHGRHWGPTFDRIGREHGYRVYLLVHTGCPANQATRADPDSGRTWTACIDFKAWAVEQVAALHPVLTVVSNSAYRGAAIREAQFAGQAEFFAELTPHSDRVVMIGNTPHLPRMPGVCLSRLRVDLGDCLLQPDRRHYRLQRRFADVAAAAKVRFIDAFEWFCTSQGCPSVIGDFVPLRDKDHVAVPYSEHLAGAMARRLGLDEE